MASNPANIGRGGRCIREEFRILGVFIVGHRTSLTTTDALRHQGTLPHVSYGHASRSSVIPTSVIYLVVPAHVSRSSVSCAHVSCSSVSCAHVSYSSVTCTHVSCLSVRSYIHRLFDGSSRQYTRLTWRNK